MKKSLCLAVVCTLMLFVGCGSKEITCDVNALGESLHSGITYQDELGLLDYETAGMFLNLSGLNVVNSAIYEGAGGTAEEIVVLECASAEEAAKAQAVFDERIADQIDCYTDYVPGELTKLNNAVMVIKDKYAVLSVSDDPETAKKLIEDALK